MKVTTLDGKELDVLEGESGLDLAKKISLSLAKVSVAYSIDGEIFDLNRPIQKEGKFKLIKQEDPESFEVLNHSTSHLLAEAIQKLYPGAKFGFGPAIEEGFYYDIDFPTPITDEDLVKIEKEMKKCAEAGNPIIREEVSKEEALEIFKDNEYKVELINGINGQISLYRQGKFVDLCAGPHIAKTSMIKHFKLLSLAGAYWRGNSDNKQLTRIYGTSWWTKEELDHHLAVLEDRKARDHRKLGKELGIFMFDDLVGKGLPMWLPNGFLVRRLLADYIMDKEYDLGYVHVMTPSLGNVNLYKTSGHWDHYKDDMFPAMDVDQESYVLRPMNCPHHMVMFRSKLHSYRDLPVRIAEIANDFRFEASGALTGIERTRAFSQNDSHIFCRPDQIAQEFKGVVSLILDVYKDFGFKDYRFRLSLRDPKDTAKYFGNDDLWEKSENELRSVLNELGVDYYEAIGEAAFYGPKLDVQVRSAIGHDVTLSTIQLDYQLPERFELTYIDENNEKVRPVVIHRAILGSMDRFIAFLLEWTKGSFPTWLAPKQVSILPVAEPHLAFCKELEAKLKKKRIRVNLDASNEKLSYRMRASSVSKIPYTLVIGDKEVETNSVTYRVIGSPAQTTVSVDEFIEKILNEIDTKSYDR